MLEAEDTNRLRWGEGNTLWRLIDEIFPLHGLGKLSRMENSEGKAHLNTRLFIAVGIVLDAYFNLLLGGCFEIGFN